MTDFRALCEELVDELQEYVDADLPVDGKALVKTELLVNRARAALAEQPVAIGLLWQPCVKLPITVHVREQRPGETHISTREGITPLRHDDLIMRGVQGEEYLIGRELFEQTYRMWTPELPALAEQPVAPTDEELLQIFDTVCLSEGGTVDKIHLRGLRAVLARWGQQAPTSIPMDKLDRLIALDRDDLTEGSHD